MLKKSLFRLALHEHAEPSQRVLGVQALPTESPHLARVLREDAVAEVRMAAAERCVDVEALTAAAQSEADIGVRNAAAESLGKLLGQTSDSAAALALLAGDNCTDAVRRAVASHTLDTDRRRVAIEGIRDENELVALALTAAHSVTRMAAAERVQSPDALRRLADAAGDKDRGVARHVRQRVEAIDRRAAHTVAADEILAHAEALVVQPGPIVQAAIELERRWKALELNDDADRRARWDVTINALQARFDREHEQQRTRVQFERRLGDWLAAVRSPPSADALDGLRTELLALRTHAQEGSDAAALAQLDQGELQLSHWEQARLALAGTEKLVIEAEQLAAGTPIDDAQLPQRWHALDAAVRTPELTRRFEAALLVIEQRRLAYVRAAKEQESSLRQQLHALLHTAEQALAAGQLQAARAAAESTRALKPAAGVLPKPTLQRLGRVTQQLTELERWQSFGQHSARVQLCERAEEVARRKLEPSRLAQEVQKLRSEWKALDQEHADVPKSLWDRFNAACETAYAPAAAHFAQLAAQRKEARAKRQSFVASAAEHASTLLNEPRDWRAITHWLRDTERTWLGSDLGSVDPGAWKKIDANLRAALDPIRQALATARNQSKADREVLVAQAVALAAKASERDAPTQVRALQARWKEGATVVPLAPRDERVLWEQFHAACDAVFSARDSERKEMQHRKHEHRRGFEHLCEQLEQLVNAEEKNDAEIRRVQREVQAQWKSASTGAESAPPAMDARLRKAVAAVDVMLTARKHAREAEVWQTLVAKERLCEELDALVIAKCDGDQAATAAATVQQRWTALPPLPGAWEKQVVARRDAALHALSDHEALDDRVALIERESEARREALLQLELLLGLETPPDLRAQRLALQVRQLQDRFKSAPATGTAGAAEDQLLAWCVGPGVVDAPDRQRCERIIASLERRR